MEKIYKLDPVIIDTGVVYALADRSDIWHKRSVDFMNRFRGRVFVPSPVISEACYLLNSYLGFSAEMAFLNSLINKELHIEHINEGDLLRILDLLNKYSDQNIGFVDASVVAIAERLNIKKVLTTDRRHFLIIQPTHCERFTIFP